jgi:hypothetical protein
MLSSSLTTPISILALLR